MKKRKKNVGSVFYEKADQNENKIVDRSYISEQNSLYCTADEVSTCRKQPGTRSSLV